LKSNLGAPLKRYIALIIIWSLLLTSCGGGGGAGGASSSSGSGTSGNNSDNSVFSLKGTISSISNLIISNAMADTNTLPSCISTCDKNSKKCASLSLITTSSNEDLKLCETEIDSQGNFDFSITNKEALSNYMVKITSDDYKDSKREIVKYVNPSNLDSIKVSLTPSTTASVNIIKEDFKEDPETVKKNAGQDSGKLLQNDLINMCPGIINEDNVLEIIKARLGDLASSSNSFLVIQYRKKVAAGEDLSDIQDKIDSFCNSLDTGVKVVEDPALTTPPVEPIPESKPVDPIIVVSEPTVTPSPVVVPEVIIPPVIDIPLAPPVDPIVENIVSPPDIAHTSSQLVPEKVVCESFNYVGKVCVLENKANVILDFNQKSLTQCSDKDIGIIKGADGKSYPTPNFGINSDGDIWVNYGCRAEFEYTSDDKPTEYKLNQTSGSTYGGDVVIIKGDHFTSDTKAYFGGVLCEENKTLNEIVFKCITPAHAPGLVDVEIKNNSGTVVVLKDAFTYVQKVKIDKFALRGINIYGGEQIFITGRGFSYQTKVYIDGILCGQFYSNTNSKGGTSAICTTPPHSEGFVDLKLEDPDNGTAIISNTIMYIKYPFTVSPTLSLNNGTVYGGQQFFIRGTGFSYQTKIYIDGKLCGQFYSNTNSIGGTSAICTTPAHTEGFVNVTVVDPDNGTIELPNAFQYIKYDFAVTGIQ